MRLELLDCGTDGECDLGVDEDGDKLLGLANGVRDTLLSSAILSTGDDNLEFLSSGLPGNCEL